MQTEPPRGAIRAAELFFKGDHSFDARAKKGYNRGR